MSNKTDDGYEGVLVLSIRDDLLEGLDDNGCLKIFENALTSMKVTPSQLKKTKVWTNHMKHKKKYKYHCKKRA